jgi:hypothetical protein
MSNKQITPQNKSAKIEVIFLGIDVHTEKQVVVRQRGADTPQPAQRFNHEKLIAWIAQQQKLAVEVYSCYETPPLATDRTVNLKDIRSGREPSHRSQKRRHPR